MITASVAIFQDQKNGILIYPRWKDECGVRILSEKYTALSSDYTELELGKKILQAIMVSEKNEQEDPEKDVFQKASGLKSWNAFQKRYESVEICILDTAEWKIARCLKKKGHSYGLDKDEVDKYTRIFPEALPAEEIGKVVLEMFAMK